MPNYVAVELNESVMVVACSKGAGRSFQINELFEIPTEELSSDIQIGEALRDALAERGVAKCELLGVVNRKQVEMREVTVPPAPDNELPDLVRFQARNVFASMNDSWKLDYVPFGERESDSGQLRVLAIAISPNLHDQYTAIAEAAGMKLKRIVFGPYSCCCLYETLMNDDDHRLIIVPAAGHFDFTVTTGPDLVATRMVKSTQDCEHSARQIVNEVRRTIASTKSSLGGESVQQILLGANEQQFGSIGSEISSSMELPVSYLDVFTTLPPNQLAAAKPEHPEHFASVIGSLAREYSSKRQPVDFANPRKPVVKKTNYKPMLIGAGVLGLALLMLGAYAWYSLSSQNTKLEARKAELGELVLRNKGSRSQPGIDQRVGEVELLDEWEQNRINWLDELAALSELLLTPDDIIVTGFQGDASKSARSKMTLKIRTTKEIIKAPAWKAELFKKYSVSPGTSTPDAAKSDYPYSSTMTLQQTADRDAMLTRLNSVADQARIDEIEAESLKSDSDEGLPAESPITDNESTQP